MGKHQVIVSNVGTVYDGPDPGEAKAVYDDYKKLSKASFGRAAGEAVTRMRGDIIKEEHLGRNWLFEGVDCIDHFLSARLRCDPGICPACSDSLEAVTVPSFDKEKGHWRFLVQCYECGMLLKLYAQTASAELSEGAP